MNGHAEPNGDGERRLMPGDLLSAGNKEYTRLLEAIAKVRDLDSKQQHALPQIIVCGATSAGKSSVLESIIQVPFPRSEGMCTRYVTQVTIKPARSASIRVRILPDPRRSPEDIRKLRDFSDGADCADGLPGLMEQAHKLMLPVSERSLISKDMLVIDIAAPRSPHLSLLDLPGLIAYDQTNSGAAQDIEDLVCRYMAMEQSMVLVVVAATEDLNNQRVLELVKKHDPQGRRTLGILTRPDAAEPAKKVDWIDIIQGRRDTIHFEHGWHIVRNRTTDELRQQSSQADRDAKEQALFACSPWNAVRARQLGIQTLRERLCEMLFSVARREVPALRDALTAKLGRLDGELNDMGSNDLADDELMRIFRLTATRLRDDVRDHAGGEYRSNIRNFYYNDAVRLRARIVEKDEVFRDNMLARGHAWKTLVKLLPADPDADLGSVYTASDDDAAASKLLPEPRVLKDGESEFSEVARMLNDSRGTLLPTFHDPRRINDLFWRMSEPWNAIARVHIGSVYQCCRTYFKTIAPVAFAREDGRLKSEGFRGSKKVAEKFVELYIVPKLNKCHKDAEEELQRLEEDRQDFAKNGLVQFLKDRRSHRQGREFRRAMQAQDGAQASNPSAHRLDQTTYAHRAKLHTQDELTLDAAESHLDAMWSHYLIDRDVFIMNVLRQIVERHFMRPLANVVPQHLDVQEVRAFVREDIHDEPQRKRLERERAELQQCLSVLQGV